MNMSLKNFKAIAIIISKAPKTGKGIFQKQGIPTSGILFPSSAMPVDPVAKPTCLSHEKYTKLAKQPQKNNFAHFLNLA